MKKLEKNLIQSRINIMFYDAYEWEDADKKPLPKDFYEMLNLMKEGGKVVRGWWTGSSWDGLKISQEEKIIKWQKLKEYFLP